MTPTRTWMNCMSGPELLLMKRPNLLLMKTSGIPLPTTFLHMLNLLRKAVSLPKICCVPTKCYCQALNGICPQHAKSWNPLNFHNSFAVFCMIKYTHMHKFHRLVYQLMRARCFKEKSRFFLALQPLFELRVTLVGPAACDANTFARIQLGERSVLGTIVLSSTSSQVWQGCVGWKLLACSCSFPSCINTSFILVLLFSGSLSLEMNLRKKPVSGWWNLTSTKTDGRTWR
jgi:hypothetical protein